MGINKRDNPRTDLLNFGKFLVKIKSFTHAHYVGNRYFFQSCLNELRFCC